MSRLVGAPRQIPVVETRDDAESTAALRDAVTHGPGAVVLRGRAGAASPTAVEQWLLDVARGIGEVLPQNEAGDVVDRVAFTPGSHARGAKTRRALPFHTDLGPCEPDVFLLACVTPAGHGGATTLVDVVDVWPELDAATLDTLAEPFPFDISDNAANSPDAVRWLPVLRRWPSGRVAASYNRARIHRGYRALSTSVPASRAVAMDALDAVLAATALQRAVTLQAGDVLGVDNHRYLHARDEFSDHENAGRLLLRVWLAVESLREPR